MKRLVVCCDGTWNTPEQEENNTPAPTNVIRLYNSVAARDAAGTEQLRYYHPGVGVEGGFFARTAGGLYGAGIDQNIMSGYGWLARHYRPGDAVYLFGFSRGAYTARSLAGFIGRCGLPDTTRLSEAAFWKRVATAYEQGYRHRRPPRMWRRQWPWLDPRRIHITFIGVWDTVGALGIPDDLALLNLLDNPQRWRFHDTRLGSRVRFARQALALDEWRANFTPTLWTDAQGRPLQSGRRVKQLWFPGVHADVGGGYADHGLSDIALQWMIDEARATGLAFDDALLTPDQVTPAPRGPLHNSRKGLFKALPTRPRPIPRFAEHSPWLHESAWIRHKTPPITQAPYHPTTALDAPGATAATRVYAMEEWNETGVYLPAGTYDFAAEGEWVDKTIPCGPAGTADGEFRAGEIAHLAGTLLGKLEGVFKSLTGNEKADFKFTRRVESAPWFSLIGVVANGGNPAPDSTQIADHQMIPIGAGQAGIEIREPGYLYAFANDAWHFYGNNRGSVRLTVTRRA